MIRRASKEKRTDVDGTVFDSAAELRRWKELQLLERAGKIYNLRRQVKFPLVINGRPVLVRSQGFPNGRPAKYTCDFVYCDPETAACWPIPDTVEDYKSYGTEAARLRIAIAECIYGFRVKITGHNLYRSRRKPGATKK